MCVPVCEGKRERDIGGRLGLRYKEEIFLTCSKNSNWVLADLFTVTFLEKITNLLLRPRLKNLLLSLPHTHARTSKHLLETRMHALSRSKKSSLAHFLFGHANFFHPEKKAKAPFTFFQDTKNTKRGFFSK